MHFTIPPLIRASTETKVTINKYQEQFAELLCRARMEPYTGKFPMITTPIVLAGSIRDLTALSNDSRFVKVQKVLSALSNKAREQKKLIIEYQDIEGYDASGTLALYIHDLSNRHSINSMDRSKAMGLNVSDPAHENAYAEFHAFHDYKNVLTGYCYELLLEEPGVFHAMFNVLRYGFYPLTWRGPFPEGYCLAVHLPFDQPAPPVPPECRPSPDVVKKYAKPPKHPKPMAIAAPDVPPLPAAAWNTLIARARAPGGAAAAFREHFAVLAETDACRVVLDRIAAIATGLRKDGRDLIVDFPAQTYGTTHDGEPMAPPTRRFLRCPPPYTGTIAGLPPSCVAVIRRHNGLALHTGTSDPIATNTDLGWHPYKKPRFQLEADVWFSPDEWDPDELFMTVPQVPLYGESDIWLLHPQRLRAANEPEVVRMSHDFGTLCTPLPYGAGGAFLRLLAHHLDVEGGAGDLRDDGR